MVPKETRWGILATGGIAETFTKDLQIDPATRNVQNVKHAVVAAASSSSLSRAQEFLKTVGAPASAKPYGSYAELVKDDNIDIIYVATPHSHHYQNVMLCLEAGKNVLCERPLPSTQRKPRNSSRRPGKRYFPLSIYVREAITSGKLGTVIRVSADNSFGVIPEETFDTGHRMVNPDLAGGILLDTGIYSLTWVFQTLYLTQDPKTRKPPHVLSSMQRYPVTGADELTTILLTFPRDPQEGGDMHATATGGFRTSNDIDGKGTAGPAVRIQGTKGEMQVWAPIFRPTRTRLVLKDGTTDDKNWPQPGPGQGSGWYNGFGAKKNAEGEGHGMFWEADEAATALLEGRKEGKYESLDESVLIMEVMDEVRKQNGLTYPEKIETTERITL
ncbi:dimeric dihydrodiol dehydrogenase [Exophiala viscosa]|uniref:dimeric dihydrodiol dehydrogenase n=1 Tax=Exophiala viscosa TaxID=2486360 RepID=UPI002199AEB6|nr:dimeric dihydrodiol dehydrogenase [Exophiala viscosa]